jgi:hypothetical protein
MATVPSTATLRRNRITEAGEDFSNQKELSQIWLRMDAVGGRQGMPEHS